MIPKSCRARCSLLGASPAPTLTVLCWFDDPSVNVLGQLQAASEGVAQAQLNGDRHGELAGLAKTTGAVHALLGMTATCDDCGEVRSDLQQISQIVLGLKDSLRAAASCNPDGVVSGNE